MKHFYFLFSLLCSLQLPAGFPIQYKYVYYSIKNLRVFSNEVLVVLFSMVIGHCYLLSVLVFMYCIAWFA